MSTLNRWSLNFLSGALILKIILCHFFQISPLNKYLLSAHCVPVTVPGIETQIKDTGPFFKGLICCSQQQINELEFESRVKRMCKKVVDEKCDLMFEV